MEGQPDTFKWARRTRERGVRLLDQAGGRLVAVRYAWLPLTAAFALALSACGGGGGGPSATGAPGSVRSAGDGTASLGSSPSAGGVKVGVTYAAQPVIRVTKGGVNWALDPAWTVQPAPAGWAAVTKLNASPDMATELFRAVAKIAGVSDEDYLLYGYWNRLPLDSLDDYKPFYHGKTLYTGNVRQQTGRATYSGGATGVYRLSPPTGSTSVDGRFTADVTISVSFGADSEPARLRLSISNIATLTSAGATGPALSDNAGLTARTAGRSFTGTGDTQGSRWGGQFFGPSSGVPTGVAGWFEKLDTEVSTSTTGDFGSLSGAFGAKKQ